MNKIDRILENWKKYEENSIKAIEIWERIADKMTKRQKREVVSLVLRGIFKIDYLKRNLKRWEKKGNDINEYKAAIARSMIAWDKMEDEIWSLDREERKKVMEILHPKMKEFDKKMKYKIRSLKKSGKSLSMDEIRKILGGK